MWGMREDRIKIKVQKQIVTVSVLLLCGKFFAFLITNSVGILTDALESIVNVVAGLISLYSLNVAAKPRDVDHPFGHGKVELISASIEGILIFLAGLAIIYEGIRRLFYPSLLEKLDVGIILVALAGLVNYLLGWYSIRIGKKYDSIALVAGGKHLQSDTYSSIGLVSGLLLLYWTGIARIDSTLALIFGFIIVRTGILILRKTIANLMDKADMKLLKYILGLLVINRREDWIDIRDVKILKYGNAYFIDCNLTLPWYYDIRKGHAVCTEVGKVIAEKFPEHIRLNIHTDPCKEDQCPYCMLTDCGYRLHSFVDRKEFTLGKITEAEETIV